MRRYTDHATLRTMDSLDAQCLLIQLADAGLARPSAMIHDLVRMEVRGIWEDEEIVVVVDEIGEAPSLS